tara:strand:+ start:213 stop:416 length:204 start_codon:yes stop_codon:yes gene_type:complete
MYLAIFEYVSIVRALHPQLIRREEYLLEQSAFYIRAEMPNNVGSDQTVREIVILILGTLHGNNGDIR